MIAKREITKRTTSAKIRLLHVGAGFYRITIDGVTYEIENGSRNHDHPAWYLYRGEGDERELVHESPTMRGLRDVLEEVVAGASPAVDPLVERLTRLVKLLVWLEVAEDHAMYLDAPMILRAVRVALALARRHQAAVRHALLASEGPNDEDEAARTVAAGGER